MSRLHAQLHALATHVRDPTGHPGPAGIPERRLQVYRELVRNNLDTLLGGTFPVLRDTLGAPAWAALLGHFLREHHSRTPLFPQLGLEFVAFLAHVEDPRRPWLAELADYEWAELGLQLAEATALPQDAQADLLDACPRLSPLAWPRAYRWPVQQIGPGFQPQQPPAQPTLLLLRRDDAGRVHFSQLSPLLYRLLKLADGNTARSGRALLLQLAEEAGQHDTAAFLQEGLPMLARLRQEGVLAWGAPAG
ncbi:MAG: DUF2063 domain-containing protein [Thermomonas haemolytica]